MKIAFWNDRHALFMLLAASLSFLANSILPILLIGFGSFSYFIALHRHFLNDFSPFGGYANWVTFLRLVLVCSALFFASSLSGLSLGLLLTTSVLLDVVDGYLARKFNQTSVFGQYFDMEVDALFVLGMCFYYYLSQDIPSWILLPAIMRYVFRATTMLFNKVDFQEKKKSYAAFIAGTFFVILLLCTILEGNARYYSLLVGSLLIIISFSISFWEYFTWQYDNSILQ